MIALLLASTLGGAQQPVPQPFPRPGSAQPASPKPAPPPPPVASPGTVSESPRLPTEAALGIPIYPAAQFITSYEAGRGQRYYLFGAVAPFADLVTYYRTVLKQKGDLVFDVPATHEFVVGKFDEDTMAFPAGVTIKDFQSSVSQGFPNPKPGGQPARFMTIIQIVPPVTPPGR